MYGVQAGLLNQWIQIFKAQSVSDNYGSSQIQYTPYLRTRAAVDSRYGGRQQQVNEITSSYQIRMRIRKFDSIHVDESCRIKWDNSMWQITSVVPNTGVYEFICERVNE